MELGGFYFFFNVLMNVLSWFVAAALYSLYYPAGAAEPAHGVNVSTMVSMVNYSANVTGAGAPSVFACNRVDAVTPCYRQRRRCRCKCQDAREQDR